jgi:hypothetical protein
VCRLFSHTFQPLFLLFHVRAIKLLIASCAVFVLDKLGSEQAAAVMFGPQPAKFRFRLFRFRSRRLL